jgi:outer membrane protein assembly factor BamA
MKPATTKYLSYIAALVLLFLFVNPHGSFCQKKYTVTYAASGKDTSVNFQQLKPETDFENKQAAQKYINELPVSLLNKGFPVASVDLVTYDSSQAKVKLYLGEKFKWAQISTDSVDEEVLERTGWNSRQFENKPMDFLRLRLQEKKISDYYENNGYPFASVSLKNISFKDDLIKGELHVTKGPLYHIDSIRVYGKVKIKNLFLQHYLGIYNGSLYNNAQLQKISTNLKQLPFLQEQQNWDVTMLGSGATLNLYLEPKRSSQVNVLVGFAPANTITKKSTLTADVHLDLKNSFGAGENILLNWQQLQPQSPRLNLGYSVPYVLKSNFGFNFSFDLLKRDSSYLQLKGILGIQYFISADKTLDFFYQAEQNYLLAGGLDTNQIISSKILPPNIDVRSDNIGVGYQFQNTNYRLNPRKGNEVDITATAGIKKTKKNNDILNLKDPFNPDFDFNSLYDSIKPKTYQFKIVASAAHFFPLGKAAAFKTSGSFGWIESPQNFQNELFRIGGYRLLRGFDEESIYANKYAVFTGEYRYLLGINSYFFGFSDVGFTKTKFSAADYSNSFISGGVGLEFETRFGLLNLSYAVGKRNDIKFDHRNSSKIHFGYINYF